nr:uncharacterized protein LOC116281036 isoform X2 [Vicugna pacos]
MCPTVMEVMLYRHPASTELRRSASMKQDTVAWLVTELLWPLVDQEDTRNGTWRKTHISSVASLPRMQGRIWSQGTIRWARVEGRPMEQRLSFCKTGPPWDCIPLSGEETSNRSWPKCSTELQLGWPTSTCGSFQLPCKGVWEDERNDPLKQAEKAHQMAPAVMIEFRQQ